MSIQNTATAAGNVFEDMCIANLDNNMKLVKRNISSFRIQNIQCNLFSLIMSWLFKMNICLHSFSFFHKHIRVATLQRRNEISDIKYHLSGKILEFKQKIIEFEIEKKWFDPFKNKRNDIPLEMKFVSTQST